MFEFTEGIDINTGINAAWSYLTDIKHWWLPSNPEHEELTILDAEPIGPHTRIRIKERVAGLPGEAEGTIVEFHEPHTITWQADTATYRFWGIRLDVGEGVRWALSETDAGVHLSATVWASFPKGLKGRLAEALFSGPLHGVEKDRQHARTELEFVKRELEDGG